MASGRPENAITEGEILDDLHHLSEWAITSTVRWSDLDANGHLRGTAYSDLATDARLAFFAERGLAVQRLLDLGIGPVVLAERLSYASESRLGDELTVGFALAALSRDASRGTVESGIVKRGGRTAAVVAVEAGWLSLADRTLVAPPAEVAEVLRSAPRTSGFELLDRGGEG
jgi:acyl-CoA thioester hydrolase